MKISFVDKKIPTNELVRYSILFYWSIFWLFNIVDKIIGGSLFLWVGRDRFAQFQKFFASAGLESPAIANFALIVAAALEVFAFVFFTGALIYYLKKKNETSRAWFFIGIVLTLITFTIFSIGDHIFGDRFELLEHTLFWFLTLFSWVAFL
jgi:glycerol uptake facilitator-like aquaporin